MTGWLLPFLVSLVAAGHALVAASSRSLPAVAIALAVAAALGRPEDDQGPTRHDPGFVRVVQLWAFHAFAIVAGLLLALSERAHEGRVGLSLLVGCQVLSLLLRGTGLTTFPVFANALALTVVTASGGGRLAQVAVAAHASLVVLWLALRHGEGSRVTGAAPLLAGLGWAALSGGSLALVFAFLPSPAAVELSPFGLDGAAPPAGSLGPRYLDLLLWSLLALALLALLHRLLGRTRPEAAGPEPPPRTWLEPVEPLPPAGYTGLVGDGPRARVVAAYLRLLADLARLGRHREPATTPREHSLELPPPALELAVLFGLARYGLRDLDEADPDRAESLADAVREAVRSSPASPS